MKTLILIIYLSACLLVQCNPKGNSSIDRAECERLSTKTQELINNYLFFDEGRSYARLDSALVIIDSISGSLPYVSMFFKKPAHVFGFP